MITHKHKRGRTLKSAKSFSAFRLTSRFLLIALAALVLTSTLAVLYLWLRQAAVIRSAASKVVETATSLPPDLPTPAPQPVVEPVPQTQKQAQPHDEPPEPQYEAAINVIAPAAHQPRTAAEVECSKRLGSGLLLHWASTQQPFITQPTQPMPDSSTHSTPPIPLLPGSLDCSSITIPNMPPPTAPHSFCLATNLYIFPHTFQSAQAPKHRSTYAFGTMQHWRYPAGAFALHGTETGKRRLDALSADHMRDVIEAVQAASDGGALQTRIQSIPANNRIAMSDPTSLLLLVTREAGEHVNLYHTMTDWYNAYLVLVHLDYTKPEQLKHVRVLFLDNHPIGYLDPLWQSVFSPAHPILTVRNLTAAGDTVVYSPRVAFSPAGYSCPIWVHLREEDQCVDEVDMMGEFGRFVKRQLGVTDTQLTLQQIEQWYGHGSNDSPYGSGVIEQHTAPFTAYKGEVGQGKVLHVVVVSRRPYKTATVDHSTVNRQIFNEPDLMTALQSITASLTPTVFSHLHLALVDFARIPINTQILLCSHTDLLIGVHGAALSHALFLPPLAALLELQPQQQNWRIFQHMQQWSHRQGVGEHKRMEGWEGLDGAHSSHYGEWRNQAPARERRQASGDGMDVDVNGVKAEVERLVRWRDWKETQLAAATVAG